MVIQSFADVAKAIGTYWLALIVLFEASPYSATLAPLTVIVVNHCKQLLIGLRSRPESSPIIPRMTERAATDLPAQEVAWPERRQRICGPFLSRRGCGDSHPAVLETIFGRVFDHR
jgi:hypothetical protein